MIFTTCANFIYSLPMVCNCDFSNLMEQYTGTLGSRLERCLLVFSTAGVHGSVGGREVEKCGPRLAFLARPRLRRSARHAGCCSVPLDNVANFNPFPPAPRARPRRRSVEKVQVTYRRGPRMAVKLLMPHIKIARGINTKCPRGEHFQTTRARISAVAGGI